MTPQLDAEAQCILDVVAAAGEPHLSTLPVDQARKRLRAALIAKGASLPLYGVTDVALPSPNGALRLRIYRPKPGPLPPALFLHGGGWTVNDIDTHDDLCRQLARRSGWLLASLDYRKAPEHRHPAQLEDAHLAYRWLLDNAEAIGADGANPALFGESSGGNTAAGLALLLRDLGAPTPLLQALAYPALDYPDRWPSYRERGTGYILDRELMFWYLGHLLAEDERREDPYLFPLTGDDLSGLPPTLLLTAEFDPLRDEGIAYARRLAEAGVEVEHVHAEDQMHGFLLLGKVVTRASALIDSAADALARARDRAST